MRKNSIFLVDNDPVFGPTLSNYLRQNNFDVTYLKDGRQAIGALHYSIPDLMICSAKLPYYSGLEITQFLREQLKSDIPILMFSKIDDPAFDLRAKKTGVSKTLLKPINPKKLLKTAKVQLGSTNPV